MSSQANDTDNNFTVLRLLLAVLVVLGHFKAFVGIQAPPWPFNYAAAAVDCFFVVSGYLVTNSFDRDSNVWRFYLRRFFRIYPLYIAVVIAQAIALGLIEPAGLRANASSLIRYLFFNAIFANFAQHDIGHGVLTGLVDPSLNASLWTLKIEFGFYLILPFLWRLVQRYGAVSLAGIFVASAAYYAAMSHAGHYQFAKQLPGQLQYFVLGIAAYRYRAHIVLSRGAGLVLTIVLAATVTALLRIQPLFVYPLVIAALVIVAALYAPRIRMKTDISYGVYLLHAPIIQLSLLFGLYRPGWMGLLGILAIVIALALVAERVIELPGIALGRYLSRLVGPKPRVLPPAPVAPDDLSADLTVLVLNDFCYVQGGASKVAIDEAIGLARSGARVIFLAAVGPPCPQLQQPGITIECLDQRELIDAGRHPFVALQALWNRRAAQRTRVILSALPRAHTIVHLHGYTKALSTSPLRVARRMGFQTICTLHDFFAACPNGAFFNYATEQPCAKRALSPGCVVTQCDKRHYGHKLFRVARGVVQRQSGRLPGGIDRYISLSARSAAILSPYLPARARLYPLKNVVDVVRARPVEVAQNRTILYIGRLDPEKGIRLMIAAAQQLGLPVTLVGDGPLRAEIETLPGITVTGWLPAKAVQRWLDDARCLIFPSLWYETYGLTVAEAAARGVPAVVSDISAAAERVENGVTGWRFRSGNPTDLMRCLKLIGDDDLVRQAGAAAYRAYWADAETQETHAGNLRQVYSAALQP